MTGRDHSRMCNLLQYDILLSLVKGLYKSKEKKDHLSVNDALLGLFNISGA